MKVIIDDVEYVRAPQSVEDKSILAALEVRFDSDAGDNLTIREYLHKLLETLWYEQEGFSGKRPFGNSGWNYDLYHALAKAGFVEADFSEADEDGYQEISLKDYDQAHQMIYQCIDACFFGAKE